MSPRWFVLLRWGALIIAAGAAAINTPEERARIYIWAAYFLFISVYALADEFMERNK